MPSINAVILMGGKGERFSKASYTTPKPFIPIHGVPMFRLVLENIYSSSIRGIYIVLHEEFVAAAQQATASLPFFSQIRFIPLRRQTRGSAETLLALNGRLPQQDPFFTINCDQLVTGGLDTPIQQFLALNCDVMIAVFESISGAYLKLRAEGETVQEMGRDLRDTSLAAAGIYFFRSFASVSTFLTEAVRASGDDMEPCITIALEHMLKSKLSMVTFNLGNSFTPLGTPEDIQAFNTQ